ncbi:YebC/PmpR family DNA-binding transcriptional regulator [Pelagibacterales bacterium SAG-MED34]|nr:YebC/PmpR family DNA-binding transcriptional regulator [Pelagibacterales bacterium SAG-MED34]
MAGHSHWAGIKHKKGKADKQRSAIFSKLSREITVAAKLGDKNPDMNSRLRSAIQAARSANMPKDNIERAIDKSSIAADSNFENIRYEGFGPAKSAIVVITLTDNKNRTASNIRTIFQKHGGGLGTQGSASHNFLQLGVIKIEKEEIDEEKVFNLATDAGASDCIFHDNYYEIHTNNNEIYDVKNLLEKEISNFISTEIEWVATNKIKLNDEDKEKMIKFLEILEEDDDVQNVFTNAI